jgi:outer membrane receptor protein involved in Fe transport
MTPRTESMKVTYYSCNSDLWLYKTGVKYRFTGVRDTLSLPVSTLMLPSIHPAGRTATVKRDAYHVLDLSVWLKWRIKRTITAFVKNVTDTVYVTDYINASMLKVFGGAASEVSYNSLRYFYPSFRAKL